MKRYIAFLHGINIGGHRVRMEHLRALFSELGFSNVRSYIQTGNIFFETFESNRDTLTRKIEQHLFTSLGYAVPVFLRTVAELEASMQLDPFKNIEPKTDTRFLITFIPQPLPDTFELPHSSPKGDYEILRATDGEVFSVFRIINGRPSDPVKLIERTSKMKTTSRFFHTTVKILHAALEDSSL